MPENDPSLAFSNRAGQFLYCSLFDASDALEMLEEGVFCLRTNAFDVVQFGVKGMLGALIAMEGDCEAVYLILQLCKDVKKLRCGLYLDGDGVSVHQRVVRVLERDKKQFVGAVLVVLGKARDRDGET